MDKSLLIGFDEVVDYTFKAFPGNNRETLVDVAHAHRLCQRISKHATCRGLEVVARTRALIQHQVPYTGRRILVLAHGRGVPLQNIDEFFSPWMILREIVENVHECHSIPTHTTTPEAWRLSRERVGPPLLF